MDGVWFAKPHLKGQPWSLDVFADGRKNLAEDLQLLANAQIVVDQGAALDFGCGPGRVTQALATMFTPCYGVEAVRPWCEVYVRTRTAAADRDVLYGGIPPDRFGAGARLFDHQIDRLSVRWPDPRQVRDREGV